LRCHRGNRATKARVIRAAWVFENRLAASLAALRSSGAMPRIDHMVVIGHSQGGLLTRMIALDAGMRMWDATSEKRLDELNLKPGRRRC
jgi:triacylglycerol esterase/lipase EstA (alpha/beta hydrolase family)